MPRRSLRNLIEAAIECASVRPAGNWFDTAIRCRARPNHKPCDGHIVVQRLPDKVMWLCPDCQDAGSIHEWEGSDHDLSEFVGDDAREPRIELLLSPREFELLWFIHDLRLACPRLLAACTYRKGRVVMTGSKQELAWLLEIIGRMETPARGEKRRILDGVVEYVAATLGEN